MGVPRAAQALAPRAGQPQGVGSEAYLNGTSQGPTPEDARKDGHIIRARCAPLSPHPFGAGPQFRGRSKSFMEYPGEGLTVAKLRRFKKISLKAPVGFAIVAAQFLYEEALIWL
ncbi:MAG: hypothetical protein GWN93_27255 [Deltaproteobacteria bacterium]|nr:hypothetical protein [Deltaproteobacteria bacterium]